jgi:RNA polymerase sigma-70 factor (ECF subfamily)
MAALDSVRKQNTDNHTENCISRVQAGQTDAFMVLYKENLDQIYRYVYSRLGQVELAEDITQEVFARALEGIASYRCQGRPFLAWLFRIAHNLIVDYRRRTGRLCFIPVPEPVTTSGEDPVSIVEKNMDSSKLREAVAQLPPAQKEAVTLRILVGLSIAETARIMGKSEGAVKSLQHDGIRNLRKLIDVEQITMVPYSRFSGDIDNDK